MNNKVVTINKNKAIKRKQVWTADLGKTVGSEQGGIRPILILQNDIGNKHSPTVTIVPLTTKTKNILPVHVDFNEEIFLRHPSIALVEQVTTIDKSKLVKLLGIAGEKTMREIEIAIQTQTGCGFDYNEAYSILHNIHLLKKEIKKLGVQGQGFVPVLFSLQSKLKKECKKYNISEKEVLKKFKQKYKDELKKKLVL